MSYWTEEQLEGMRGIGGSKGAADRERASGAAESAEWKANMSRSFDREQLGESARLSALGDGEARLTSSFPTSASRSGGPWERLATRAKAALGRDGRAGDGDVYLTDPDSLEAENCRLGEAHTVAKYNRTH